MFPGPVFLLIVVAEAVSAIVAGWLTFFILRRLRAPAQWQTGASLVAAMLPQAVFFGTIMPTHDIVSAALSRHSVFALLCWLPFLLIVRAKAKRESRDGPAA
jgi:predicted permease